MGNDRVEAGVLQLVKGLVERGGNRKIGEFDEKVILLVERKALGVLADRPGDSPKLR